MSLDVPKLVEKLRTLNTTQQSIETVSMYCQVQKRHARQVVAAWYSEFIHAVPNRKLALLYLANDVLQNSRKKGPEYVAEFHKTMPKALKSAMSCPDEKLRGSAARLVDIWDQRRVFGSHAIKPIREAAKPSQSGGPPGPVRLTNGHGKAGVVEAKNEDTQMGSMGVNLSVLKPLEEALDEVQRTGARHMQQVQAQRLLPQDLSALPEAKVGSCLATLQQLQAAAQEELTARTQAVARLQELLDSQQAAMQELQASVAANQRQLQQVSDRAAALAQDATMTNAPVAAVDGLRALHTAAVDTVQPTSAVPAAAVSQPAPVAMETSGAAAQQSSGPALEAHAHMPSEVHPTAPQDEQQGAAGVAALATALSDLPPASVPQIEPHIPVPVPVQQQPQQQQPQPKQDVFANSSIGVGDVDPSDLEAAAAALAAQLAATGSSTAELLAALNALPQEDGAEGAVGAAPLDATAAIDAFDDDLSFDGADDEYDPGHATLFM